MKNQIKKVLSFALALVMCMSTLALGILALEECDHNWELLAKQDPTCDAPGSKVEKCSECGELRTEVLNADHSWVWDTHDATCTTGGYRDGVCSVCGEDKHEDLSGPIGVDGKHDYQMVVVTVHEATKVTYTVKMVCSVCEDEDEDAETNGEANYELIIVEKPTCEETGVAIYKCTNAHGPDEICDYVAEEVVIAALGHDTTVEDAVAPDCTKDEKDGTIAYRTCSRCDKIFAEELDADGELVEIDNIVDPFDTTDYNHHNPKPLPGYGATEPHCNEDGTGVAGTIAYSACECGQKFMAVEDEWVAIDEIIDTEKPFDAENMDHHNVGELVVAVTPNCVDGNGTLAHYVCATCGALFDAEGNPTTEGDLVDEYDANDFTHHSAEFNEEVLPKCGAIGEESTNGTKAHYACDCGAIFTAETTGEGEEAETTYTKVEADALVIVYDADNKAHHTVEKDATRSFAGNCTVDKVDLYVCTVCYAEFEERETAPGHQYGEPSNSATCTEAGYIIENCQNCSNVKVTPTEALDHDMNRPVADQDDPTCTSTGKTAVVGCTRCDYTEGGETIGMTDHVPGGEVEHVDDATCTTPNTYYNTCADCGARMGDLQSGEALGHTKAQAIISAAANCETPGTIIEYCSVCNVESERREGYYMVNVADGDLYKFFETAEEAIAAVSVSGAIDKDLAHGADAWTESSKVVTCDGKTTTTYVCECGGTKVVVEESDETDPVALHKAAMEAANKEPVRVQTLIQDTCTTPGTSIFKCTVCNENYTDTVTHELEEDYEIAPDCTTESNGYKGTYCHTCSTETTPVWVGEPEVLEFEHDIVNSGVLAPTCTAYGYDAFDYCTVCTANNGLWSMAARMMATGSFKPLLGHAYADEFTIDLDPTCTEEGSKSRHCTRDDCDAKTEVTPIPEEGHAWLDWQEVTPAGCETTGTKIRYCGVCGEHEDGTIPALRHNEDGVIDAKDPWCEKDADGVVVAFDGWREATYCTRCYEAAEDQDDFIAAIKTANKIVKHNIKVTEVVATYCDEDSYTIYDCAECGIHNIVNYVYGVDHVWGEAVAPTCQNAGYIECTVCGDLKTADDCTTDEELEELKALEILEHKNAAGEILENKCTNEAEDRVCVGCGETFAQEHTEYYYNPMVQEQTCTTDGIIVKFCDYCGFYELTVTGEATGHTADPEQYIERVLDPTLDEVGYDAYTCATCDEVCYVEVEKLKEIVVDINAVSGINANGAFVNGGLVTFTIDLTMPEVALNAMFATLYYNPAEMSFVEATVNNSFAGEGYTLSTDYYAVIEDGVELGRVNIFVDSIVNNARQDVEFVADTVVEGFVTITFRLAEDAEVATLMVGEFTTTSTTSERYDIASSYETAETIELVKLGNLNGDNVIDMHDVNAIRDLIAGDEYNAAADLNMDGELDILDWAKMKEILLEKSSYEDLFNA